MSDSERVAVELEAMKKLAAVLEPLEIVTRERVLKWAQETLVREVSIAMTSGAVQQLAAELDKLKEQAGELGVTPATLVNAYAAMGDGVPKAVAENAREDGEADRG